MLTCEIRHLSPLRERREYLERNQIKLISLRTAKKAMGCSVENVDRQLDRNDVDLKILPFVYRYQGGGDAA